MMKFFVPSFSNDINVKPNQLPLKRKFQMKYLFLIFIMLNFTNVIQAIPRNDGAYKLKINLSGSLQNPAFSSDGQSIVFTRFRDGYNKGAADLFIYNLKTKALRPLISEGSSNISLPGSVWNNLTHSIVFSSDRGDHDEIFFISDKSNPGNEIQLTSRYNRQAYEPSFSPDGLWIVFESHKVDVENDGIITKYNIYGNSGYLPLTAPENDCRQPNWSPKGDKILYQKQENGKWAIWTMDINGGHNMRITIPQENSTDAVFSYDGQWIIYSSENEDVEIANIYKISINGGLSTRLTIYKGYDGAPSISPNAKTLIFESSEGDPDESKGTSLWIMNL